MSWQLAAKCGSLGSYFFFAPDDESAWARVRRERAAKAICAACPVLTHCRRHALEVGERYGIWGGMTESERRAARQRS